jgi:hypothetical protein
MRSSLLAASFFATLSFASASLLAPQQPSISSSPDTSDIHISNGPGSAFHFTKIDNALLADANAIDSEYEKDGLILHDPGVQACIDAVGNRILGDRPKPEKVTFRFIVLRDAAVDAFAQPNGSIYITTGLLALLQNDAQLAGVLAQETAHVYDRHPYLANRSFRKDAVATNLIATATTAAITAAGGGFASAAIYFNVGARVGSLLLLEAVNGYSSEMESQADKDGLAAMSAAGYNPQALADAFQLLDQSSKLEYEPYRTLFNNALGLEERQKQAETFASEHPLASPRTGTEKDYFTAVAPAIVSSIVSDLESRLPRTAVARAARLSDFFPGDSQYQVLLGESYRALGAETAVPTADELTPDGENKQRKLVAKMSEQQEQREMLRTPEGRAALQQNRADAEKFLLAAIAGHPDYAPAYRELGFLYEDEARYPDAAANYQHYLQMVASTSLDRLRIERRLSQLQSPQPQQPH